jgi:hypothetical protein
MAGFRLVVAHSAAAQDPSSRDRERGVIDGIVSDSSARPLSGVTVSVIGTAIRVVTNDNGRFRITRLPTGQYTLSANRIGLSDVSLVIDVADTVRPAVTMHAPGAMLDTVRVVAAAISSRLLEFEYRRHHETGTFITAETINRRNATSMTEIFRGIPSLRVREAAVHQSGPPAYYAYSTRPSGMNPYCPLTVLVDDVALPTPFDLDLLPAPSTVAGIEVYAGAATVPTRYAAYNRGCGIALVWTKA